MLFKEPYMPFQTLSVLNLESLHCPPMNTPPLSLTHHSPEFQAHEMGAMVCCYSPKRQLLLTGGNKGDICIFDVRQRKLQHMFKYGT